MAVRDTRGAQDSGAVVGSNARVLVWVLCGVAMLALGLVNLALVAVLSSASDQGGLTRPSAQGLLGNGTVDPDDFRKGLTLTGQPLAQREAELARTADTSPRGHRLF